MRELKFRAWDKKLKIIRMVISLWLDPSGTVNHTAVEPIINDQCDTLFIPDFEIMQCTGQKDKNGIDIYEGDVKREEEEYDGGDIREYYVCTWIKEWCMFAWLHLTGEYNEYLDNGVEHLDETMFWTFTVDEKESKDTVICGNIYEHPRFLTYNPDKGMEVSNDE